MDDSRALATLIRSHRPHGANAYYLQNDVGRYPKSGGWALDPFVPPVCPAGSYSLAFLPSDAHNVPLPPQVPGTAHPVIQVPEMSDTALVRSKERAVVAKEDPLLNHPDSIKNRVDSELTTFADAGIQSRMMLTELGQSFAYAQAWRQEAQQAMESMSVLLHRERERLINERSKQGSALAEAQAAKPPTPPDHFGSGLVFLTQILSLLAPGKKDGESVLDALIANDSVESAHKTALRATKAELERAKAALDEAQEQAKQAEQARLAEQSRLAEQAKLAEQARAAAEARFAAIEAALAALQSEKKPSIKKKPSLHRKHKLTRTSR